MIHFKTLRIKIIVHKMKHATHYVWLSPIYRIYSDQPSKSRNITRFSYRLEEQALIFELLNPKYI